jgi:hypothetical protein
MSQPPTPLSFCISKGVSLICETLDAVKGGGAGVAAVAGPAIIGSITPLKRGGELNLRPHFSQN